MSAELLTVAETATRLRISSDTVRKLIQRDEIPAARVGCTYRVSAYAVAKILEPCQQG